MRWLVPTRPAHTGKTEYLRRKQGMAIREDVEEAVSALRTARGKLTRRDEAIRAGILAKVKAASIERGRR